MRFTAYFTCFLEFSASESSISSHIPKLPKQLKGSLYKEDFDEWDLLKPLRVQ